MSVRKLKAATYRVRWRDVRGRQRQQTLIGVTRKQAEDFELEARRQARVGELPALDRGGQSLAEFAAEWWEVYAVPNLAANTKAVTKRGPCDIPAGGEKGDCALTTPVVPHRCGEGATTVQHAQEASSRLTGAALR